jgi:hypothetical protein
MPPLFQADAPLMPWILILLAVICLIASAVSGSRSGFMLLIYVLGLVLLISGLVALVTLPLWAWFVVVPIVVWFLVMLRAGIAVSKPGVADPIRAKAREDAHLAYEAEMQQRAGERL